MEATCRTCPFFSPAGTCREARVVVGTEIATRAPDFWCSAHPLRQRDRLAAMALQGLLAALDGPAAGGALPAQLAGDAYRIADAMLAERERLQLASLQRAERS